MEDDVEVEGDDVEVDDDVEVEDDDDDDVEVEDDDVVCVLSDLSSPSSPSTSIPCS